LSVADDATTQERDPPGPVPASGPGNVRCLAVASGKGGVGKTIISVGLAHCLVRRGYRVLLVDADMGLANVDIQIGIDPTHTLQDVACGRCSLADAVTRVEGGPDVLPASSGVREMVNLSKARRDMLAADLIRFSDNYDFMLIDSAAGIGGNVTAFLSAVPHVLVVMTNEPPSLMDAYSLIKVLHQGTSPPHVMMVVNMVRSPAEGQQVAARFNVVVQNFLGTEIPVAGVIVEAHAVGDAIRNRKPLPLYAPECAPVKCLQELARTLAADEAEWREGGGLRLPFLDGLLAAGEDRDAGAGQQAD